MTTPPKTSPDSNLLESASDGAEAADAETLPRSVVMPLGLVLRCTPGVTRWQPRSWRVVAVLPGAAAAEWVLLREEGETQEYHAATLPLELHRADAEAYRQGLTAEPPSVYVILRDQGAERPELHLVTASPFEAQDYADTGEDLVEKTPMPEGLVAWVRDFTQLHHREETFKKRKRDRQNVDLCEDGIGDVRISQLADVYRAPGSRRKGRLS